MKREKLLIIVKDYVEEKIVLGSDLLSCCLNRYIVYLMSPAIKDQRYKKLIRKEYPELKFIDFWPREEIKILDQIKYWLKSQLYFLYSAYRSKSCFQKIFLNTHLLLKPVLPTVDTLPFAIRLFRPLFNSPLLENILKVILVPLLFFSLPFKSWVFSSRRSFTSKINSKLKFDHIFFVRPDSTANMLLYNSFSHPNTIVTTMCRNWDTPALRGIFAVPSNETLAFEELLANHIKQLNRPSNFGNIRIMPYSVKKNKVRRIDSHNNKKLKILYATSASFFATDEPKLVEEIYRYLEGKFGKNFELIIRLIYTDSDGRYQTTLNHENVSIDKSYFQYFDSFYGKKLPFFAPDGVKNFKDSLKQYDLLLSTVSTINYEAHLLGVNTCYLHTNPRDKWIYQRDHFQILIHEMGLPVVNSVQEIGKFLI